MRTRSILFFLLTFPLITLAQSVELMPLENFTVCGESKLIIEITNATPNNISSIDLDLDLPCGVSYVSGTVDIVSEGDIQNLNTPSFSLTEINAGESYSICMEVKSSCETKLCLDQGELFQHALTVSSSAGTSNYTSPIYNIETANPIIRKIDSPLLKAVRNQTIERQITIRNTRPGRLSSLTFVDAYTGDLEITTDYTYTNENNTHTTNLSGLNFMSVGNQDAYLDFNEEIILTEYITVKSCPLDTRYIKSDLEVSWGCDGQFCSSFDSKAIIEVELIGDPDDVIGATTWLNNPLCDNDSEGRGQRLQIKHKGSINDLVNVAITINSNSLDYSIKEGSVEIVGYPDYTVDYNGANRCHGKSSVTLFVDKVLPNSLFNIYWSMPSCELGCDGNANSWTYQYSYEKDCAPPADRFISSAVKSIGSPDQPLIDAELLIEKVAEEQGVGVGDSLIYNMKISNPSLASGSGSVTYEIDLPCDITVLQSDYTIQGISPSSLDISGDDTSQKVSIQYPLPFPNEAITIPILTRIDNNAQCAGSDCIVEYITSCPDAGVGGVKEEIITYQIEIDHTGACESPITFCNEQLLLYSFDGPPCPVQVPGYVDYSFDVYRTTYGLPDNDNDAIADEDSNLDVSAINLQAYIWGDTMIIEYRGRVVADVQGSKFPYGVLELRYKDLSVRQGTNGANAEDVDWFKWMFIDNGFRLTSSIASINNIFFQPNIIKDLDNQKLSVNLNVSELSNYVNDISQDQFYENNDSINLKLSYVLDKNPAHPIIFTPAEVSLLKNFKLIPFFTVSAKEIGEDSFSCDADSYDCSISGGNTPVLFRRNSLEEIPASQYCDSFFVSAFRVSAYHGSKGSWFDVFENETRQVWIADTLTLASFGDSQIDSVIIQKQSVATPGATAIVYNPSQKIRIADYLDVRQDATLGYNIITYYSSEPCSDKSGAILPSISFLPYNSESVVPSLISNMRNDISPKVSYPSNVFIEVDPIVITENADVSFSYSLNFEGTIFYPIAKNGNVLLSDISYVAPEAISILDNQIKWNTSISDSLQVLAEGKLYSCDDFIIPLKFSSHCDSILTPFEEPCLSWHDTIYIQIEKGLIEMVDLSPSQEVNLCEVNEQRFTIINADLGNLESMRTEQRIAPGFSILGGSVEVAYPSGSDNWVSISDPQLSAQVYLWDWNILLMDIGLTALPGVNSLPANGFDVRYQYKTDCDFISGSKMIYRSFADQHCGDPANIIAKVSGTIDIKGLEESDALVDLQLLSYSAPSCDTLGQLFIIVEHSNTDNSDSLYFTLPSAYLLSNFDVSWTDVSHQGAISFDNIDDSDILTFSIALNSEIAQCGQDILSVFAATGSEAICIETNQSCNIGELNGQIDIPVNIDLPILEILNFELIESNQDGYSSFRVIIENQSDVPVTSIEASLIIDDASAGLDSYDRILSDLILHGPFISYEPIELQIDSIPINLQDLCQLAVLISADDNCICRSDAEYITTPLTSTSTTLQTYCESESISIGIPDNGNQYLWRGDLEVECDTCATTNLTSFPNIENTADFNFTLIEYIDAGCFIEHDFVVSIQATPQLLSGDISICKGDTVSIFASLAESYSWIGSDIVAENDSELIVSPEITSEYILMSSNASGCDGIDTVTVTVLAELSLVEYDDISLCYGNSFTLELPSTEGLNYQLFSQTLDLTYRDSIYFSDANSGTHELFVEVDNGLCSIRDTFVVAWFDGLEIDNPYDTIVTCVGDTLQYDFDASLSYQWFPSQSDMCLDADCSSIQWVVDQSTEIIGIVSDLSGCIDTIKLNMEGIVDTTLIITDSILCAGEELLWGSETLTAPGMYCDTITVAGACKTISCLDLEWTPMLDTTVISDNICYGQTALINDIEYDQSTADTIILTSMMGCDSLLVVHVEVDTLPLIEDSVVICSGQELDWMDEIITTAGIYTASEVNDEGCMQSYSVAVTIEESEEIIFEIVNQSNDDLGSITSLSENEILSYEWDNGSSESSIDALTAATYAVTITDENGCMTFYDFQIELEVTDPNIFVPNVFSHSSINDVNRFFRPVTNSDQIVVNDMLIFDRWGNLVFDCDQSDCIDIGWDGTYNGKPAMKGVYIYKLSITISGTEDYIYGSVTLL